MQEASVSVLLLLDQGLPFRAAGRLTELGIDALHVRQIGLAAAPDDEILDYARTHGRTCVTLDGDFHRILALSGARGPNVIRIRAEGLHYDEAWRLIASLIAQLGPRLATPVAVTATRASVRIRHLPFHNGAVFEDGN